MARHSCIEITESIPTPLICWHLQCLTTLCLLVFGFHLFRSYLYDAVFLNIAALSNCLSYLTVIPILFSTKLLCSVLNGNCNIIVEPFFHNAL